MPRVKRGSPRTWAECPGRRKSRGSAPPRESGSAAIGLKKRNPRFHLLKGLAEQKLGHDEEAEESFAKAKRYGKSNSDKIQMLQDLISLNTNSSS